MPRLEKSNFQLLVDAGVIADLDQLRANLTSILDTFTPEEINEIIELATEMNDRSEHQFSLGITGPNIPNKPPSPLKKGKKKKKKKKSKKTKAEKP